MNPDYPSSSDSSPTLDDRRQFVTDCWYRGVAAVRGEAATVNALAGYDVAGVSHILSIGKAADAMCRGALSVVSAEALVIVKEGHLDGANQGGVEVIESAHPIPDQRSLDAGQSALNFVSSIPEDGHLLMLVSGGASALVECLPEGLTLSELQVVTDELLANGYDIEKINEVRKAISLIKGGKLLDQFSGRRVTSLGVSDIPDDNFDVIGSGIGSPPPNPTDRDGVSGFEFNLPERTKDILAKIDAYGDRQVRAPDFEYVSAIIASNSQARQAVADYVHALGLNVRANLMLLNDDVFYVAEQICQMLRNGENGIYLFGGEPTINLPDNPGRGGRNQSLSLAIAEGIQGERDIIVIAAGTDGTDGPTAAAGGIVDGRTALEREGLTRALEAADAGTWLEQAEALFTSGPTDTNVMDLVVAIKGPLPESG